MGTFIVPIQPMELGIGKMDATARNQGGLPFQDVLTQVIDETRNLMEIAEQDSVALALGDVDNLAQIQINSLKASTMLQTTVQLTSRAVTAYKEIMQMQI